MLPAEQRLRTRAQLKDWLAYEKKKYGNLSALKWMFGNSERAVLYRLQRLLRKTEYYRNSGKPVWKLWNMRLQRQQNRYAIHIPLNTCAKGLYIMHVGPVLLNSACVVGENCTFHMNTALVAGGTNDCAPVLGRDIVIGIGAVVLGDTHIADGVAIGANAVVNKDVTQPNITMAGVPAKKVSDKGRADWNKKQ